MQLPFFKKNSTSHKPYLGLFLKETEGTVVYIEEDSGVYQMKDKVAFVYTDGWERLLEDIDDSIFRLEQKYKVTFKEAIFFVFSHLIDRERKEIKKPYVEKIKDIVKNLELKALGYIESYDAVSKYLEKVDNFPLTAVLVETDATEVGIFVYKGGVKVFEKTTAKTQNIAEDIVSTIETAEKSLLLPNRLILYNVKDKSPEAAAVLSHHWKEGLFMQVPKVEIVKEETVLDAFLQVFHEQVHVGHEQAVKEESNVSKEEQEQVQPQEEEKPSEVMGFVMGKDVAEMKRDDEESEKPKHKFALPKVGLPRLKIAIPILALIGLLIIVLSLFLNEFYLHTATLTVHLPSSDLQKKIAMTGSTDNNGDFTVLISTSSAEFSESKAATGKKDIGEKARGAVTIYNLDDKEISFPSGTILAVGDLSYVLDSDTKVGGATIDQSSNETKPAKTQAAITASAIGPELNLEQGKRFKIGDLSQTIYYAINDDSLKGGSKKTIQTVSKNDIELLKEALLKKAEKSSELSSSKNTKGTNKIIDSLSNIELTDIRTSKEIGEEASSVTLQANVAKEMYSYNEDELKETIYKSIESDIRDGYEVDKKNIHFALQNIKQTSDNIQATVNTDIKQTLVIDEKNISREIKLKNKQSVDAILKDTFHVKGYDLIIRQPLPFLQGFMPLFEKNIRVTISAE